MARITEKNRRFRTKDQIVQDAAFVLQAPVAYGTRYAVLQEIAWVWTEFHGKYHGCPFWTKSAIAELGENPDAKRRPHGFFRHEHVVPKRVIIEDMLMKLKPPTIEAVGEICNRFLIGVVVTLAENRLLNARFGKSMPSEFYDRSSLGFQDPWLRYKRCGIELSPAPMIDAHERTAMTST